MFTALSIGKNPLEDSSLSHAEKSCKSILMRDIFSKILDLAKLNTPVVLIGEIGVEKKRIAKIIHENSNRAAFPFYTFYCVDLNDDEYKEAFREKLLLSEDHFILKYDVIEKACNGILYLDQFSELSDEFMLNMVRSFTKGSQQLYHHNKKAKPRLIISVNMESYANIINSPHWQTILQLLDPYTIMIPPLRERREDIPLLIHSFLKQIKSKSNKFKELSISDDALNTCSSYSWPGNIRQLQNALLQGAVLSHKKTIQSHHFPFSMYWKLPYDFGGKNSTKHD